MSDNQVFRFIHTSDWEPNQGRGRPTKRDIEKIRQRREVLFEAYESLIKRIQQERPDALFLTGDLFQGSVLTGNDLADWTRARFEVLFEELHCLAEMGCRIYWTLGSHDVNAWKANRDWTPILEFPGVMFMTPSGHLVVDGKVAIVGFGGLDANLEKNEPWRREAYLAGIEQWSEFLENWKGPVVALSPTKCRSRGFWFRYRYNYVGLGSLQGPGSSKENRRIPQTSKDGKVVVCEQGRAYCMNKESDERFIYPIVKGTLDLVTNVASVSLVNPDTLEDWGEQ